jgi:hypothetical protein
MLHNKNKISTTWKSKIYVSSTQLKLVFVVGKNDMHLKLVGQALYTNFNWVRKIQNMDHLLFPL